MKKTDSMNYIKNPILETRNEYYKNIGEQAAVFTFTKRQLSQKKLQQISPISKGMLKTEDSKKPDIELNSILSPLNRDISHLQDKFIAVSPRHNELPSDIQSVKKLLESSDALGNPINKGFPVPYSCRKEPCLDPIYKQAHVELPSIDKLFLGGPTGRQECSNLRKWLDSMKETYCINEQNDENSKILYMMCSKELIRQVSVQCVDRGDLLNEVLEFFINRYDNLRECLEIAQNNTHKVKRAVSKHFKNKEIEANEKFVILEYENKILHSKIMKKNKKLAKLYDELADRDEKIEQLTHKFFDEEENNLRATYSMHKILRKTSNDFSRRSSLINKNSLLDRTESIQKSDAMTQTTLIPKAKFSRVIPKESRAKANSEIVEFKEETDNKIGILFEGSYHAEIKKEEVQGGIESLENAKEEEIKNNNFIKQTEETKPENYDNKLEKETQTELNCEIFIGIDAINIDPNSTDSNYQNLTESDKDNLDSLNSKSIESGSLIETKNQDLIENNSLLEMKHQNSIENNNLLERKNQDSIEKSSLLEIKHQGSKENNSLVELKHQGSLETDQTPNSFEESPIRIIKPVKIITKNIIHEEILNEMSDEEYIKDDKSQDDNEYKDSYVSQYKNSKNFRPKAENQKNTNKQLISKKKKIPPKADLKKIETLIAIKKAQFEALDKKIIEKKAELESLSKFTVGRNNNVRSSIVIKKIISDDNENEKIENIDPCLFKQSSVDSLDNGYEVLNLHKRFSIAISDTENAGEEDENIDEEEQIYEYPRSFTHTLTPINIDSRKNQKSKRSGRYNNEKYKKCHSSRANYDHTENNFEIEEESCYDISIHDSSEEEIKDSIENQATNNKKNFNAIKSTNIEEFNFHHRKAQKDSTLKKNPAKNILSKLQMKNAG